MILQEDMLIVSNINIAPRVFRMVLKGEIVSDITAPDQFLHIRVPSPDKILRRPISISEYNNTELRGRALQSLLRCKQDKQ